MRRMLREPASHAHLVERGWAPLPAMEPAETAALLALATERESFCTRHSQSADVGFDELWGNAEDAYRYAVQAQIATLLLPILDRWFTDHRAVIYNFFIKRARSPRSSVRYHYDFSVVDERQGDVALQLWVPLVDTTPENGSLILREGSHRHVTPIRPHDYRHPASAQSLTALPPDAVCPAQRAGQGVVFTNRTLHGSPPNLSAQDRPALGAILVPAGVSVIHWVRPAPDRAELWALSDDDFRALHPGRFPPGARLVETVTLPTAPARPAPA